jgi:hypothetical protein
MITSLNLALSTYCTGRCVFCPSDRGKSDLGYMDLAVVRALLAEVTCPAFPWQIKSVQLSENGDALMNPFFDEIVSMLRHHLPRARINLTTNLANFREYTMEPVLRGKMLDSIGMNIDGHDAESYEAQKGISYERVLRNLRTLCDMRMRYCPDMALSITVLTLQRYVEKTLARFGHPPLKAPQHVPPSSLADVKASLAALEWMPLDISVRESPVFFWAERDMELEFDQAQYQCPQLPRVESEAFISPSGLWYPCCLDANHDQAYGSVVERSLLELHDSDRREAFIRELRESHFKEIGYPCSRVPFCQGML